MPTTLIQDCVRVQAGGSGEFKKQNGNSTYLIDAGYAKELKMIL